MTNNGTTLHSEEEVLAFCDGCKLCTTFGNGKALTAVMVAENIVAAGVDTSVCFSSLSPYANTRPAVVEALREVLPQTKRSMN